ncbi:MAG: ankyrin repeat domain-containing protein [Acetobacter sp.]|nr:ankyrin repeat domain-containing protein [Acetobacter sp.]
MTDKNNEGILGSLWNKTKALKYEYWDGLNAADADNKAKYGVTKDGATQGLKNWVKDNELVWTSDDSKSSIKNLENLVAAGANVNVVNDDGTALMIVCECVPEIAEEKAQETIKYLLDHGADINKQDKNGQTPLMHSMHNINELGGNVAVVTELLKHHPDLALKNNSGKTVMDIAKVCVEDAKARGDTEALVRYEKVYALLKEEEKRQIGHDMHNQGKVAKPLNNVQEADKQIDNRLAAKQAANTKSQTRESLQSKTVPVRGSEGR